MQHPALDGRTTVRPNSSGSARSGPALPMGFPACVTLGSGTTLDFVEGSHRVRVRVMPQTPARPAQGIILYDGAASAMPTLIAEAMTFCVLEGALNIRAFGIRGPIPPLKRSGGPK